MPKEYIARDAAIIGLAASSLMPHQIDDAAEALRLVPAADVRPVVRGKWEKGTGENGVTTSLFCSVCHYENTHWREWNFCPNCGAKMDGGQEDGI